MIIIIKKILEWLFALDSRKKKLIQVSYDTFAAVSAFLLALTLRLETIDYFYLRDTYIAGLIAVSSILFIFIAQGLYNNITRYISVETAFSVGVGSFLSCMILLSGILLLNLNISLSVSPIYGALICIFVAGMRVLIRHLSQNLYIKDREQIAIYGAGSLGIQLMDTLRKNPTYYVTLFIDDNPKLYGKNVGGIRISDIHSAKEKLESLKIKTLFLVNSLKDYNKQQRILNLVSDYPIKIKTIPSLSQFLEGKPNIDQVKDIKIEDLLGREPVEPFDKLMKKNISNKIVLVTGAGGSVGSELCRQIIVLRPKKLIMIDVSEFAIYKLFEELKQNSSINMFDLLPLIGSVQDNDFLKKVFNRFKIETIYHAAAYKHVPLMEQNTIECIKNNVFGTFNIAELSIAAKVKNFILVSTDKAVNPTNFMGASKRIAELICLNNSLQKKGTCFSIVRFGNVLSSSGSVVPLFQKQIEGGGPITLTHVDVTRYFMTITEAAQLVIQAGSIGKDGDIFVLDMGKPIKIFDLAKQMVYLSGKQPVFNTKESVKDNEIAININGLRPGEKLFEELSYNSNLMGTVHPRINTTLEKSIKIEELQKLLRFIKYAIDNNDYQKLFENIAKVSNGISKMNTSTDLFLKVDAEEDAVLVKFNKKL